MISDYYTETLILLDHSTAASYWSTGGSYSTDCTISAAVNLLSGGERADYGRIGHPADYKAYCEYSTEIVAGRRVVWDGDTFEISDVPKNTLGKNHHLKFLLKQVR